MVLCPRRRRLATIQRGLSATSRVITVAILIMIAPACVCAADPPAIDRLLRLAPEDSVCVATVENLREQARRFAGSRIATVLWRLPPARAWLDSAGGRRFTQARERIETILGVRIEDVRDDLFGDAVALAVRVPERGAEPQGLLLVQVRDRALLLRVLERLDQAQKDSGELERILDRRRGEIVYHGRVHAAVGQRSDWYVATTDGVFAFSSEESMITGAIDRWIAITSKGASPRANAGFGDSARLAAIKKQMPANALAQLYLDPRRLERLIPTGDASSQPAERRVLGLLARAIAAVDYAGAAVTWDDAAITLHVRETLDPAKLAPWVKRWAADDRVSNPRVDHIPPEAIAAASIHIDAKALHDGLVGLLSDAAPTPLDHVETVLTGLLLGQDLRAKILPRLGPRVVAFVEAPVIPDLKKPGGGAFEFPMGIMIGLDPDRERGAGDPATANRPSIGSALENALKTVLALAALDDKRGLAGTRIITSEHAGARITGFETPALFTFALDQDQSRLVVGTSRSVVAHGLSAQGDAKTRDRFRGLAAVASGGESLTPSFVVIDIQAAARALANRRVDLAQALAARQGRSVAAVDGDLAQVLALAHELEAVVLTHAIKPDAAWAEQTFRLSLANEPVSASP